MKMFKKTFCLILFIGFFHCELVAQNEVLREQNSLYGIAEFGVVVNIEKPDNLDDVNLSVVDIQNSIIDHLEELPVRILKYQTLQQSDQFPILYLHINVMEAMSGMYPFSAEMKFYQPVKLPLNNDIQTMASTWHDSFIGVVTPDLTEYIASRSARLAINFRIDFQSVN